MQNLVNRVQLIGHLGMDPEVKIFETGKKLHVSIATDASYKDKDGKKVEGTDWHNLVAWDKTAELAEKIFKKGRYVAIEGKIVTSNYEDKDGNKQYRTDIRIEQFLMLDKKED